MAKIYFRSAPNTQHGTMRVNREKGVIYNVSIVEQGIPNTSVQRNYRIGYCGRPCRHKRIVINNL
ncbi:MAG: hypothetical protein Q4G08_05950 [Capnocytophaga sp.]|nr:hypothetical protein [Capnocytophaga sp.]